MERLFALKPCDWYQSHGKASMETQCDGCKTGLLPVSVCLVFLVLPHELSHEQPFQSNLRQASFT